MKIQLASSFDDSQLDGCLKFKAAPTLAQRDPQTAAVIATTGGLADDAGVFHIKIAGSAGKRKLLARLCTDQVAASD